MGNLPNRLPIKNDLQILRYEMRVTQQQLAEAIGVTRATIISIEGGNYNPSLELAFRISLFFKKNITEIFYLEDVNEN